jgi:hypothetical protein
MATAKGPIFQLKGSIGNPELLDQLQEAVEELAIRMKATVPIKKGQVEVGFGVDKTQRNIAADAVISIVKAIKSVKGW